MNNNQLDISANEDVKDDDLSYVEKLDGIQDI